MVNLSSIGGCGIIIKHHSLYTAPVMVNLLISLLIGPTFLSYLLISTLPPGQVVLKFEPPKTQVGQ